MSELKQPRLPLPDWLHGCDQAGSFAHQTITTRMPGIARQTLESRPWPEPTRRRLQALIDEMPHGALRPLNDADAPDAAAWEGDFAPYVGQTWLEAPWFVVEMYFFRRILEATGYYHTGPNQGLDPYHPKKAPDGVLDALHNWHALHADAHADVLPHLLHMNIWGNQDDRSMWTPGSGEGPQRPSAERQAEHLLIDDAQSAGAYLINAPSPRRVDFLLDNCGVELALDLALADYLLDSGLADAIQLHVKPHPTYVSDATRPDVLEMIAFLISAPEPTAAVLGQRLQDYLAQRRLWMTTNYFWTSPRPGWQMPPDLYAELARSTLLINKGDANYRRWLGDRRWPFTTPIAAILNYLPAPWLALRVLKSNLLAGLPPGQEEKTAVQDDNWLYNGRWGCIQFVNPI